MENNNINNSNNINESKRNKVIKISIVIGAIIILLLSIVLPITLANSKGSKLYVSAPNYCYFNEDIDVNSMEVYSSNGTKLNKDEYSISPKKFDKKFDGVQMVSVTSKNGESNKFPVKMLESYEMNEQSFKNFTKELETGNKIFESNYKGTDDRESDKFHKDRESSEKITKFGNRELSYAQEHAKTYYGEELKEEIHNYTCNGYENVYDEKTGIYTCYSLPATLSEDKKEIKYMLDYNLIKGTTEFNNTPVLKGRFNVSGRNANFNNYKLKEDKTYEFSETYYYVGGVSSWSRNYTFENGKIVKLTGKEISKSNNGEKSEDEYTYTVKREETKDPFVNVQKLNYQYAVTDLEGNKFETTVNDGSTEPVTFNFKFFEDYDSANKKYINEVTKGVFVDAFNKDLLLIENKMKVNAVFDENEKCKVIVTPTGDKFEKGQTYAFYIKFNQNYFRNNFFMYYINNRDFVPGIRFVINVI